MAGALSLQAWQWGLLALAWGVFFLLPAVWMARRARRDGDQVFVWTALVLAGSLLGVLEYFHHRSILRRRAKRAARAAAAGAGGATGERGPDEDASPAGPAAGSRDDATAR